MKSQWITQDKLCSGRSIILKLTGTFSLTACGSCAASSPPEFQTEHVRRMVLAGAKPRCRTASTFIPSIAAHYKQLWNSAKLVRVIARLRRFTPCQFTRCTTIVLRTQATELTRLTGTKSGIRPRTVCSSLECARALRTQARLILPWVPVCVMGKDKSAYILFHNPALFLAQPHAHG